MFGRAVRVFGRVYWSIFAIKFHNSAKVTIDRVGDGRTTMLELVAEFVSEGIYLGNWATQRIRLIGGNETKSIG